VGLITCRLCPGCRLVPWCFEERLRLPGRLRLQPLCLNIVTLVSIRPRLSAQLDRCKLAKDFHHITSIEPLDVLVG